MSHVIPVHIFQTLKYGCWNCNVCCLSRKMTVLNYVRLLGERGKESRGGNGLVWNLSDRDFGPRPRPCGPNAAQNP